MADKLRDRAAALENEFFAHRDQELLAKLRDEMEAGETRSALSAALGIEDAGALDALLEHQIAPQTMLVIGLIPMVAVAWSDGVLDSAERDAITKAADLDAWKSYTTALTETLDGAALATVRDQVIGRAESTAKAAGGFLGLGNKVSDSEQKVIDELKLTFSQS